MNHTMRRRKIKWDAKRALAGNWLRGAGLVLCVMLVEIFGMNFIPMYVPERIPTAQEIAGMNTQEALAQLITLFLPAQITREYLALIGISLALSILLVVPLSLGIKEFFLHVSRGKKPKIAVAFSWYTDLRKVFGGIALYLAIGLRYLLWGILIFAIPVVGYAVGLVLQNPALVMLFDVLVLFAAVLFVAKTRAYVPALYFYAENPGIRVSGALKKSVQVTRGRLWELLIFELSFLSWRVFSFLSGTLVQLFFEPYYLTATAGLVDYLSEKEGKEENQP